MLRIYPANGGKLDRLTVLEHTLVFGKEGHADGSELTQEEIDRLRKFHFIFDVVDDEQPAEDEESTDDAETDEPSDDATETDTPAEVAETPVKKPARKRTTKKS